MKNSSTIFNKLKIALVLVLSVFCVAAISIKLTRDHTEIAAVWAANAIVLAILIMQPKKNWLPLLGCAFIGYMSANYIMENGWVIATFCSFSNLVEIAICGLILTHKNTPKFDLGHHEDYMRLLLGVIVGTLCSSLIATSALVIGKGAQPIETFISWFMADGLGLLIFTPIISILISSSIKTAILGAHKSHISMGFWCIFLAGLVLIFGQERINFLPLAPLMLVAMAFLFTTSGVSLGLMIMCCTAIASCAYGWGPADLAQGSTTQRLYYLQGLLVVFVFSGLPTTIALSYRRRLEHMLHIKKQEAEQSRDILDHAKKVAEAATESKSMFLSNMSHEIRTPLNGITGLAGSLAHTNLNPQQKEMVTLIQNSSSILEQILSDILDMSRIEEGKLELKIETFNLKETLELSTDLMRCIANNKDLNYTVTFSQSAEGLFKGDALRIRQIITNLISNAVKFTEDGSVDIAIHVEENGIDECALKVIVKDTGIGFDEDTSQKLFSRFEQADGSFTRHYGGSGLGLSICKSLVDIMHGEIQASSKEGIGSIFNVIIPLERTITLENFRNLISYHKKELEETEIPKNIKTNLRILIAEDNPVNQRVVSIILESFGAHVTMTNNGVEVVHAASNDKYDLILMDMQMPEMDGLEATKIIRTMEIEKGLTRTPIAMLSANASENHQKLSKEAGCDMHISKPITPESLWRGIEKTLDSVVIRY